MIGQGGLNASNGVVSLVGTVDMGFALSHEPAVNSMNGQMRREYQPRVSPVVMVDCIGLDEGDLRAIHYAAPHHSNRM
jgi:hypothetical protein